MVGHYLQFAMGHCPSFVLQKWDLPVECACNLSLPPPFPCVQADDDIIAPTHACHESLTSSSLEPFLSTPSSSSTFHPASTNSFSRLSSVPRSRSMSKRGFKEIFEEGLVREVEMIDYLRAEKHEHAIAKDELKHWKLNQKVLEAQHQHEQHEFWMMQMHLVMAQRGVSTGQSSAQIEPSFEGLGLLDQLNATLPSAHPSYSDATTPFSI